MNITFRKIEIADLAFINETRNGYAAEYLHDNRVFTLQETNEWYNKTNPNYWIIFDDDINEKVGYFRLSNYSEKNKNIYIGADISPKFKNKGYGTEAYRKFIPLLFGFYDLNKISLEVLETNHAAIHLYEKLGFSFEGTKRMDVLKKGKWVNSNIMSYINPKNKLISIASAFYFGKRNIFHKSAEQDSMFYLKKNIEYINKLNTNIYRFYMLCSFADDVDKNKILFDIKNIIGSDERFVVKSLVNFGGSYSAWQYGLDIDNGSSDYVVLMEDDYVLYNKNSINNMLEYWVADPDLLLLCSKYDTNGGEIQHASVSNGIINNKLYFYLKKYKNLDFRLSGFINNIPSHYHILWHNQLNYLRSYHESGLKIKDFSDKFSCYFVNTDIEYGVKNGEIIFCPIADKFM